jgi:hypothetical protein
MKATGLNGGSRYARKKKSFIRLSRRAKLAWQLSRAVWRLRG